MQQKDTYAWLALYLISGLGISAYRNLLARFGDPRTALEADFLMLRRVKGVRDDVARKIVNRTFSSDPEVEMRRMERIGARILTCRDPGYPPLLGEIPSSPVILYVRGRDIPLDRQWIGVVGSRNPTHYGLKTAETISLCLAERGAGIVSGMAKGIDTAAHRGCLTAGGSTIAVLGTGVDRVYPASNIKLMEQIIDRGTVISEFPLGSPPEARNFPIRNRLISGFSRGILVVEATRKSGSLITASFALDQGRDVFAVPGSVESFKSTGTHLLIKQGAKLVENAADILEELGEDRGAVGRAPSLPAERPPLPDLDETEQRLYEIVGEYPMHIDRIVRLSGIASGKVSAALMRLELKGLVKQLPGKHFVV
jgi:DNA processing protein